MARHAAALASAQTTERAEAGVVVGSCVLEVDANNAGG